MKTIVYLSDGSLEATVNHKAIVERGDARYATRSECESYERQFAEDDARIADQDEGVNKHHIPSCFFEKGEYEVWAAKSWNGGAPIVLIAGGLCLETARKYNWPRKEIRLRGEVVK